MKKSLLITAFLLNTFFLLAQNVGIGTNSPTRKLSVNGSVVVDHGNYNIGTIDSSALLFGSFAPYTGISSNKDPGVVNHRGLDFWTNSTKRLTIGFNGNVGIGFTDPQYKLHVNGDLFADDYVYGGFGLRAGGGPFSNSYRLHIKNGNSLLEGNLTVNEDILATNIRATTALRADARIAIGGTTDENYKLRVYDGNARIGGEFHATGNSAIGGLPDANFKLRVYDGNSRFGGDVQVTGNVNAGSVDIDNTLTIGGKGSVRSNGLSPLRIGFVNKVIDDVLVAGQTKEYTVNIGEFEGGYDDVRVMVSQFEYGIAAGANTWERMLITVTEVDAAANTCKLKVHNTTGGQISLKGTLYLTVIAKN